MSMHNFKKTFEIVVPAYGTDVEGSIPLLTAPFAGVVESVQFIGSAAITGAASNNRKHEVINKGQAGAGTTVVSALEYASGVNGVAFDAKTETLSVVDGALDVAAGDVLAWSSTAPGTGIADPGGLVRIVIRRDNA